MSFLVSCNPPARQEFNRDGSQGELLSRSDSPLTHNCPGLDRTRNSAKREALKLMRLAAGAEEVSDKHPAAPGNVLSSRELLCERLLRFSRPSEALIEFERSLKRDSATFVVFAVQLAAQISQWQQPEGLQLLLEAFQHCHQR